MCQLRLNKTENNYLRADHTGWQFLKRVCQEARPFPFPIKPSLPEAHLVQLPGPHSKGLQGLGVGRGHVLIPGLSNHPPAAV